MKNHLEDLNNHLFEQLERLNNDDLQGEELSQELDRAKGMGELSTKIVRNAELQLDALKLKAEYAGGLKNDEIPKTFLDHDRKPLIGSDK